MKENGKHGGERDERKKKKRKDYDIWLKPQLKIGTTGRMKF